MIVVGWLAATPAHAQSGARIGLGAAAFGAGNTHLTVADTWAVFNNIGALGRCRTAGVGVHTTQQYGILAFTTVGAAVAMPLTLGSLEGTAGLGFWQFGDALYNESQILLGYGHRLGMVSLGIQAGYFQTMIQEMGVTRRLSLAFGGVADLRPDLRMGMHIYNFGQAEDLPTIMRAGIAYQPLDRWQLQLETEKEIDEKPIWKAGLSYWLLPQKFVLRTGASANPFMNYFGMGLVYRALQIDYALATHPVLQVSHHLSVSYRLSRRDTER